MASVTHKYIYVIRSGADMIKVGVATNVKRRLRSLQTGSPIKLAVFHAVRVPAERAFAIESAVHERLAQYELHGEWFRFAAAQAVVIISRIVKAQAAAGFQPTLSGLQLICPKCHHSSRTTLTRDDVWHRMFRCSACHAAIDGRRFFVRSAA